MSDEIAQMGGKIPARHLLVLNRGKIDTDNFPIPVLYEPQRGFSYVRNRALTGLGKGECLVFLDDDEIPQPGWLLNFWERHAQRPEALLKGPVLPTNSLEIGAPIIVEGGYRRPKLGVSTDDALLPTAGIGNALLGSELIATGLVYFDHFFAAGAEDTDLCMRLAAKGYETRFVEAARVHEVQDDVRTLSSWVRLRKQYDRESYSMAGLRNFGLGWALRRLVRLSLELSVVSVIALTSSRSRLRFSSLRKEIRTIWTGRLIKSSQ